MEIQRGKHQSSALKMTLSKNIRAKTGCLFPKNDRHFKRRALNLAMSIGYRTQLFGIMDSSDAPLSPAELPAYSLSRRQLSHGGHRIRQRTCG